MVLVGTLWPDKLRAATDPRERHGPTPGSCSPRRHRGCAGTTIPAPSPPQPNGPPPASSPGPIPGWRSRSADADRFGFAQTLAGAHELLEHYRTAPEPARLLLEAAADARRLGHASALTEPLLRALTLALWRDEHGPARPPAGLVRSALTEATRPLRSDDGVRALIPLDDPDPRAHNADAATATPADTGSRTTSNNTSPAPAASGPSRRRVGSPARPHQPRRRPQRDRRAPPPRGRYPHAEALFRAAAATATRPRCASWPSG